MVDIGFYQHCKGEVYKVIGTSIHTETEEKLVLYIDANNGKLWSRPENMWEDEVYVDWLLRSFKRFEKIMVKVVKTDFGYVDFTDGLKFVKLEDAQKWEPEEDISFFLESLKSINPEIEIRHRLTNN